MSAPWIALTTADLDEVLHDAEQSLTDIATATLASLTAEIRGMIATWSPNTLSADSTKIPLAFKARALVLARWRITTSTPNYTEDENRKLEYEKAEAFFASVAKGAIRPEPADDAIPTTVPAEQPARVEVVTGPGSRTGRTRMDGC
jgi:hypothetical protein